MRLFRLLAMRFCLCNQDTDPNLRAQVPKIKANTRSIVHLDAQNRVQQETLTIFSINETEQHSVFSQAL